MDNLNTIKISKDICYKLDIDYDVFGSVVCKVVDALEVYSDVTRDEAVNKVTELFKEDNNQLKRVLLEQSANTMIAGKRFGRIEVMHLIDYIYGIDHSIIAHDSADIRNRSLAINENFDEAVGLLVGKGYIYSDALIHHSICDGGNRVIIHLTDTDISGGISHLQLEGILKRVMDKETKAGSPTNRSKALFHYLCLIGFHEEGEVKI